MARRKYQDDVLLNGIVWTVGAAASVGAACVIGAACRTVPLGAIPKIVKFTLPYGIGGLAGAAGQVSKNYVRSCGKRALKVGDVIVDAITGVTDDKDDQKQETK